MIFLEVIVILVIVALQARVFWQNKQRAAVLAALFPEKEQLYMQSAHKAAAAASADPLQAVLQGQTYTIADDPDKTFRVNGRDGSYL